MIFKPFYHFETGCAAYVFGCGGHGKCAVVDAREQRHRRVCRIRGVKGHAHHARHRHARPCRPSLRRAAARAATGAATACTSPPTSRCRSSRYGTAKIELGNTRVKVLHTPGHTPESICLVVTDLRRGPEPWFVLTGDTLLSGRSGRPDLPGRARESAAALHDSLHARLLTLPDDSRSIPGHFSGSVCGAGMSGKPSSTHRVREALESAAVARPTSEFVDGVADVPPKPAGMEHDPRVQSGQRRQA